MPEIEIDDEVFAAIQLHAVPLVDTPNTVLRRLVLGEKAATGEGRRASTEPVSIHAQLPERDYEQAILKAIDERGGSAPAREVVEVTGRSLADAFLPADLAPLRSGKPRWQNRVAFARLRMKEEGLLIDGSPRGLWEIADAGRERLKDASS